MEEHIRQTKHGQFIVKTNTQIVVNGELEWEIKFTPSECIKAGTRIKIIVPAYQHQRSEAYLQTYDYWKPNYIYAIGTEDEISVDVAVEKVETAFKHINGWLDSSRVAIVSLDKGLGQGEAIYIRFGGIDRPWIDGIAPPSRISQFANRVEDKTLDYQVYIDVQDGNGYEVLDIFPKIQVIPDNPTKIILTSPSVVREGETFEVKALFTDRFSNPILKAKADGLVLVVANLVTGQEEEVYPSSGKFKMGLDTSGFYQVTVKDTSLEVISTVVLCDNKSDKLYWGDTHTHSNLTANIRDNDHKSNPRQSYLYAKNIAQLDYICLSEQTFTFDENAALNIDQTTWDQMGKEADAYYEPGELVTFTGFELHDRRGDTVLLFRDSLSQYAYPEKIDKIQDVWAFYKDKAFLSIPHLHRYCNGRRTLDQQDTKHGGFQLSNWEDNPKEEVLCEVFSTQWGRFEHQNHPMILKARRNVAGNSLLEFLDRGKRWGIVANSDGHDGNPGYGGLTGVYAGEKTRESIFDGLQRRRTIASTHPRVLVDYTVDGLAFGQEVKASGVDTRSINLKVLAPIKIKQVEIIKNGKVYKKIHVNDYFVSQAVVDEDLTNEETYYYIRVSLEKGHIAWASPIWFI